jgi:MFS family permease
MRHRLVARRPCRREDPARPDGYGHGPQVLASIRVLFSAEEQGQALGFYGATFGLANICGQVLGGALVSSHPLGLAWQAIFLIDVPIGLAAFIGGLLFLRDLRAQQAQGIDVGGVVLLSLTLALLVYPLVEGRESAGPHGPLSCS